MYDGCDMAYLATFDFKICKEKVCALKESFVSDNLSWTDNFIDDFK